MPTSNAALVPALAAVAAVGIVAVIIATGCTPLPPPANEGEGEGDGFVVGEGETAAGEGEGAVGEGEGAVGEGEGAVGEGEGDERPVIDPAEGVEVPGVNDDGTDCPVIDPADVALDAGASTSFTLTGTVTNAAGNGAFYVRGRNGEEIAGELPLSGGAYSTTVPVFCGDNTVKRVFSNATCTTVLVTTLTTSGCVDADLRVTTVWDALGRDWELHLIKPGGHINDNATDCTWTSCISQSPDWGVAGDATDNPHKDVDSLIEYGPENIFLSGLEDGVYTVMVEHWSDSGSPQSDGRAIINMRDKLVVVDVQDLAPEHVWTVARIHMPEQAVEIVNTVADCSANWSSGCHDAIP